MQSYTESYKLLVLYAAERRSLRPCALMIEHFTVALLVAFLEYLEQDRYNSVGTRNTRLAAIKSFFRYLEYRVPSCLDLACRCARSRTNEPTSPWSPGSTAARCRLCSMPPTPARSRGCATVPCCISATPRGCACRS